MVPDFETTDSDHQPIMKAPQSPSPRKPLNPYVASTHGDFGEERQFLRETIFPQIDAACQKRGTYFCPTNMEWKPTHPQVLAGTGLRLALDQVCRSSPFLICMIGERYGEYRPEGSPPLPKTVTDLPDDADWLDQNYMVAASAGYTWLLGEAHQNCSMLELEVMQAAFLSDNDHCLFYFRQPEHLDDMFPNLSAHRRQKKMAKYLAEDEESRLRVRDLKQRIIKKGLAVKYYRSLQDLGDSVLDDWIAVLDMLYPPLQDAFLNIGTEEFVGQTAHQIFAETRRNVFLRTPELCDIIEKLGDFAASCMEESQKDEPDLMEQFQAYSVTTYHRKKKKEGVSTKAIFAVTGDRGSGKSSIISNWLKVFEQDNPDIKVITNFIGSTPRSTDITLFMRHCISELRQHYMLRGVTGVKSIRMASYETTEYTETCEAFMAALYLGPCVLVLDGSERLGCTLGQSVLQVKKLGWLPQPLPNHCKVIVTCVSSDLMYKSLQARQDVQFVSCPMVVTLDGCRKYLSEHMGSMFSHVKHRHLAKVWEGNPKLKTCPLFLSLLVNELKCYDVYSGLDPYLENLAEVVGIREFWGRCLHRWIQTYSWTIEQFTNVIDSNSSTTERFAMVGWVPDALRLIAVSRFGLSKSELLSVLMRIGYVGRAEVSEFDWLLFREVLGDSIYEGPGGLLNFSHHHLRDCIEYILLGCVRPGSGETTSLHVPLTDWQKDKAVFHMYLANYFSSHPSLQRRVEELPWHLLMARETTMLEKVLTNPQLFLTLADEDHLWPGHRQDLRVYWSLLKQTGLLPGDSHLKMLASVGFDLQIKDEVKGLNESSNSTSLASLGDIQAKGPPKIVTAPPSDLADLHHEVLPTETPDSSFSTFMTESERDVKVSHMKWFGNEESPDSALPAHLNDHNKEYVEMGDNSMLSPGMRMKLAWSTASFLAELGERSAAESVLAALHSVLLAESPLLPQQQLLLSQTQERLGGIYMAYGDRELGETLYRKATKTLTDIGDSDTSTVTDFSKSVLDLKGKVLAHHGEMMLRDGFDEDAEEFFEEAKECLDVTSDIVGKAMIFFQLGTLKIQQEDYTDAELKLRQSLTLREQWFGQTHPLVADTVFMLGHLMSLRDNEKGYNRLLSETLFRQTLEIREKCLGENHPLVATTLLQLGKLLQCNASLSVKSEVIKLLRRALDIRTSHYGSNHPDTREARQCVHEVEVSVQLGRYEFGPAKPVDHRTIERPFSSLSWRNHELKEKQLRSSSTKRSPSQRSSGIRSLASPSRPQSSLRSISNTQLQQDTPETSHRSFGRSRKSPDKTPLRTAEKQPKGLLNYNVVPLQLKTPMRKEEKAMEDRPTKVPSPSAESVQSDSPGRKQTEPLKLDIRMTPDDFVNDVRLQSPDAPQGSPSTVDRKVKINRPLSGPARLYQRFNNTASQRLCRASSAVEPRAGIYNKRAALKATSMSSVSGFSHRSRCSETQLSPINTSDVYSLGGPCSSLASLLSDARSPQDYIKQTHHRSTWYHVPGRYVTPVERLPRKRSQFKKHSLLSSVPDSSNDAHQPSIKGEGKDMAKLNVVDFDSENGHPLIMTTPLAPSSRSPSGNVVTFTEAVVVG